MSADIQSASPSALRPVGDFWTHKTVEQLSAEQGVKPWTDDTWATMQELADELWPTDEDADKFVDWVRQVRREGSQAGDLQ